jgi:hypothetical protein
VICCSMGMRVVSTGESEGKGRRKGREVKEETNAWNRRGTSTGESEGSHLGCERGGARQSNRWKHLEPRRENQSTV